MSFIVYQNSITLNNVFSFNINDQNDTKSVNLCYKINYLYKNSFHFSMMEILDLSILFALKGYKFDNFQDLIVKVFDKEKINKFIELNDKKNAYLKSFKICKINFFKYKDDQLMPKEFLEQYYNEKNILYCELYRYVEKDIDLINFYKSQMHPCLKYLFQMHRNGIRIDLKEAEGYDGYLKNLIDSNRFNDDYMHIEMNPVGAKTGRFSFEKDSFNVYTLPKQQRNLIVANKDFALVQFDYKSFQPRLAIFSTEDQTFKDNFKNISDIYLKFPGDREKNKISFLRWMFSDTYHDIFSEQAKPISLLKDKIFEEIKEKKIIKNKFGRVFFFSNEEKHVIFQNIITSLEADCVIFIVKHICTWLESNKLKSRILFPFYDSIVMEVHKDEQFVIKRVQNIMSTLFLRLGIFESSFPVSIKIGNNFLNMTEITIKE